MHRSRLMAVLAALSATTTALAQDAGQPPPTVAQITEQLAADAAKAYEASRFSALSKDYFNRFSRDPQATPGPNDELIDSAWTIVIPANLSPLGKRMVGHLAEFLRGPMQCTIAIRELPPAELPNFTAPAIVLSDADGGDGDVPESFNIRVESKRVTVVGDSPAGLRDGVVRLVDRMGLRSAPILECGAALYRPRLGVRVGAVPIGGSYKDAVFLGANAVIYGGGDLFALSTSDAIPELARRRQPALLAAHRLGMQELAAYGLKAYAWLHTRQKFPADDPVFKAHPEIRGSLTWSADGEYNLCTSHPLVRQYLRESVAGLFRELPELGGVALIVGGEGFYHCHMRPFGVAKGHTNCPRCEPLGAEAAVADLANDLAAAAREVNPRAEVVLWPYSAEHVWAADRAAGGMLEKLHNGAALLTEIEKSETIAKPLGVSKSIWDYSIDFIGPAARTREQLAICRGAGLPVYLKSEPELAFEAPRLPHIPCMDRWADRAEALAGSGADGAWVFPAFRPFYGGASAEINKFLWWTPTPDREQLLSALADRIAGRVAGPRLRSAWRHVSAAIAWSPELPPYYTGPHYLGPMHPMIADRAARVPPVFYGRFLFRAEHMDTEGLKLEPTFDIDPRGDPAVFGECYRHMHEEMARAAEEIAAADPVVEPRCRLPFDDEAVAIRWLYHTARTHDNFYQSCRHRDALAALAAKPALSAPEKSAAAELLAAWRRVLEDERANTRAALPLVQQDMRLDPYYGGDHSFSHGAEMIAAKLELLDQEVDDLLPSLAVKLAP